MRYFLTLSYHGTAYHGWQIQPNAKTVQGTLQYALSVLLKEDINLVGAGRTDAGVHASFMVAHFDCETLENTEQLVYKLNGFLPKDIAAHELKPVKADAHARFDALEREYVYKVSTQKNVFNIELAYFLKQELDVEAMNKACEVLLKYTDFECFSKQHSDVKTFNCDIKKAIWEEKENQLHFTIKANRFLRNMVRAIVGTMIGIGSKQISIEQLHAIIQSKNRSRAGYSVPAHGLYLQAITYPKGLYL